MADLVDGAFKLPAAGAQLLPDGDPLGAMLLAFAAADAVGRPGGIPPQGGAHEIAGKSGKIALVGDPVVGGEDAGDVHVFRTGHAVAAAGAAHLHLGVDGLHHPFEQGPVLLRQLSRPGAVGGGAGRVAEGYLLR